eukprot:gene54274-72529_t
MPGAVPITSAHALNNATLVHGLALADRGLRAIAEDRHLRNGLNVHKGRITNKPVAEALGYPAHAPEAVLNVAVLSGLVTAQDQLDQVAAGLAQAMSTVTTAGSVASSGAKNGFSLDVSGIQDGSNFTVDYAVGGVGKSIKVLNVTDTSKLPLDYLDANGVRVIGVDFSQGTAAMATQLSGKLGPSFTVSGSGSTITVLDDGAAATTDVTGVTGHSVATALQNGDPALNLF